MGRPKPGATIEIGNQRRIPAIRKRQKTEAEDHEMQHNKGKPSFEGRSESIRMETGRRGERKIFEPACKQQATTAFQPHRTAAMDPLGWMSNLLWKRIVKSHVTWNGTGCLLTFSKTTKVSKILLYRHGCLQDKS